MSVEQAMSVQLLQEGMWNRSMSDETVRQEVLIAAWVVE